MELQTKQCPNCEKDFTHYDKRRKFCSMDCSKKYNTGENHWLWKGGIKTRPDGYIRDSKTDKYIHRIVMENYLGRELTHEENIHHIDGDNTNNDIKNLMIMSNSEHRKLENKRAPRNKKGQYARK